MESDGWMAAAIVFDNMVEESPGSTGIRSRVTPGGGNPRESATESKPPVEIPWFLVIR